MAVIILSYSLILCLYHVFYVFFKVVTIINYIKNEVFMVMYLIFL